MVPTNIYSSLLTLGNLFIYVLYTEFVNNFDTNCKSLEGTDALALKRVGFEPKNSAQKLSHIISLSA